MEIQEIQSKKQTPVKIQRSLVDFMVPKPDAQPNFIPIDRTRPPLKPVEKR